MDFDKFKELDYQEKVRFNNLFNNPEIQDELKECSKKRKRNTLIILLQSIIWVSLFVYLYLSSWNLKISFISTLFFSTILFMFSIPIIKKIWLDSILSNIFRKNLWEKIKFSNRSTYFKETISKVHKKTGLIKDYYRIEYSIESIKKSIELINQNKHNFKVNIAEIEYENWEKNLCHKIIIKIESAHLLSDNIIRVTQRRNSLKRIWKLIIFYIIWGILSLLSFILFGLVFIDLDFNFSNLEKLFVIFALTCPWGVLWVWSNFKNQLMNPDLVKFSDTQINKKYDIYSKNHQRVYEIFNATTLDIILKYWKIMNKKFNMYIYKNEMYIEVDINNNYLNFSYFNNPYKEGNYVHKYLKVKNLVLFMNELLQWIDNID